MITNAKRPPRDCIFAVPRGPFYVSYHIAAKGVINYTVTHLQMLFSANFGIKAQIYIKNAFTGRIL